MGKLVGNDADFGPQYLGPGDSRIDFTLKFLEIFFGILPDVSFIVLAAILIAFYRQRPACVAPAPLLWSKQVCSIAEPLLHSLTAGLLIPEGFFCFSRPRHCFLALRLPMLLYGEPVQSSARARLFLLRCFLA
jgi:hypothetical protein